MARVTVIGNATVDIFFNLPRYYLHRSVNRAEISLPFGQKLTIDKSELYLGGAGANVAIGLTKAGCDCQLISPKSEDVFGDFIGSQLIKNKVAFQPLAVDQPSALSVIFRLEAERTVVMSTAVMPSLPITAIQPSAWIHLGPLHQENEQIYQDLQTFKAKHNFRLSVNPSITTIEERNRGFLALLRLVEVLFVNEEEGRSLARLPHSAPIKTVIQSLQRFGPKLVCMTLGSHGVIGGTTSEMRQGLAITSQNERIDVTGAGDAFVSGFLSSYLSHDDIEEPALIERSIQFGLLNSGAVVSQIGAGSGLLGFEEMRKDAATVTVRVPS